jgi:hypothetical protein
MQFKTTIYFQVTGTFRLALRMESNLLLVALVALQILMALWDMVLITMTPFGSRERSMNWNVQLESSTEGMFWVVAFC